MTNVIARSILLAGTAIGLAAPALAQETAGDQTGTPTAAGTGQSAATATNAPAQAAAETAPVRTLDGDIVVTARRVEERLQDVPISITVYNQAQLTERNIVSANDLTIYTPSLTSNSRFGDETATFAIRGFVQDNFTSPSVAVYFADVVAPRASGGTSGGNGAGVGSFFDLQNVQVLKGPQGTLFGRNTTGGAILLVPQKPTGEFEGYVEGSIGNYDMRRLQGVINVPVGDTIRLRVGADRQTRDGFLRDRSGIGPDDFQDVDYIAVRGSLVIDLTPNLENYTIGTYSKSDTNGSVPKLVVSNTGTSPAGVPCQPAAAGAAGLLGPLACQQIFRQAARGDGYYDVENSNPTPNLTLKQWQVINTTTWAASDTLTLKNIASYVEFRQAQTGSIFGDNFTLPAAFGPLAGRPFGYVGLYTDPGRNNIQQKTFTEEFQVQGRTADDVLTYQVGAYYEKSRPLNGYQGTISPIFLSCTDPLAFQCIDVLRNPLTGTPGGFIQNSLTRYRFENIGFYGQATYRITEQLGVTAGLRYTIDDTRATGATRTYFFFAPNTPTVACAAFPTRPGATDPDNCAQSITEKSKKPTWLINLDYKPNEDVLLYAKYARGYRQGSVNASNTIPNAWGPEKVDAYEIGAKTSFRGAVPGFFNVAAFYTDFSNQQLAGNLVPDGSIANASPAQTIVNAGKSRIQGLEADFQLSPFEGLRLSGGYAYLDTKLKTYNAPPIAGYLPITTTSVVGGDLTLSPKHKFTGTVAYTLPLDDSIGRITFGATYTYTDDQVASADTPIGILPATNLLNLNASWNGIAGGPVDLSLFATNVTKERYPVYVGGSFRSSGFDTLILGQPRIYGARVRVRFGR